MKVSQGGLTDEQRWRLDQRFCEQGHRFDTANYPNPEGDCPLCVLPDLKQEINNFYRDALQRTSGEQDQATMAEEEPAQLPAGVAATVGSFGLPNTLTLSETSGTRLVRKVRYSSVAKRRHNQKHKSLRLKKGRRH